MKIIAKTKTGFLVDMHEDEIAKAQGFQYASSVTSGSRPTEGQEVSVNDSWNDLRAFRNAKRKITDAAETLSAVASLAEKCAASYVITETE